MSGSSPVSAMTCYQISTVGANWPSARSRGEATAGGRGCEDADHVCLTDRPVLRRASRLIDAAFRLLTTTGQTLGRRTPPSRRCAPSSAALSSSLAPHGDTRRAVGGDGVDVDW